MFVCERPAEENELEDVSGAARAEHNIHRRIWLCLSRTEPYLPYRFSENGVVNIFDRTCFFIYVLFGFKADTKQNV